MGEQNQCWLVLMGEVNSDPVLPKRLKLNWEVQPNGTRCTVDFCPVYSAVVCAVDFCEARSRLWYALELGLCSGHK